MFIFASFLSAGLKTLTRYKIQMQLRLDYLYNQAPLKYMNPIFKVMNGKLFIHVISVFKTNMSYQE